MPSVLPLAPIRDLLTRNCSFHISDTAIVILRDNIEDIIRQVGHESLEEFERLNSNRQRQGLRPLKRLNGWSIRKACDKILKQDADSDWGLQSTGIVGLGDKNMARHTLVTKSAKVDNSDNGGV